MDSLLLSLDVTVPLFIIMALGYLLKQIKLVDSKFLTKVNEINFKIFLPIMMFNNLYCTDITAIWDGKAVLLAVVSTIVIFLALLFIVPLIVKENPRRSVIVQGVFRSNYAYVGIPVAMAICGSVNAGFSAVIMTFVIPIYNALSVVGFEVFRGGKVSIIHLLKRIVTNPLIIACVAGMICMALGMPKFPSLIQKPLDSLSKVCTPLALIALGGFFDFRALKGNTKTLVITTIVRLIIIPAVFFTISIFLGMRGGTLAALFAMYATPTAVTSFTMAQMMDGDAELAGQMVIVQSSASILTMFMWVFILSSIGVF